MISPSCLTSELLKKLPGFESNTTNVNGINIHYVSGGHGQPLILIPGYPQTWWAYHQIMPVLAEKYKVIAVDMRGMGDSDKPASGYDKKSMAADLFELIKKLNLDQVNIAGHDIGAHVAYSFAANFPDVISKLIILDTPHPDEGMYQLPMLPIPGADYVYPWWLALNQVKDLPAELLEGKMNVVINWMFDLLLKEKQSVDDFDRMVYSESYQSKEAIQASGGWYQAFGKDIQDIKSYPSLNIPVLAIGGSGFALLQSWIPAIATNAQLVKIDDCGHFLMSEKPEETSDYILEFLAS